MLVHGALVNGLPQSDPMSFRGNLLIRAAKNGHKHVMRTLIEFGAEINIRVPEYRCSTLLTEAAYSGCASAFEYLLDEVKVDTNVIDAFGCTVVSSLHPVHGWV
jgi:ankyrin repeat protein